MTSTITRTTALIAEAFTTIVSHTTTTTSTITWHSPSHTNDVPFKERVIIDISVEVPLSCKNYWAYSSELTEIELSANPDIAGIGVCMPV